MTGAGVAAESGVAGLIAPGAFVAGAMSGPGVVGAARWVFAAGGKHARLSQ